VKAVALDGGSGALRAAVERALATRDASVCVLPTEGTVEGYVHLGVWESLPGARPFAEVTDDVLVDVFERPLLALIAALRLAHGRLARPGAQVVVVVPTAAMAGAPGLAATAAAAEAQRQLAKSVARQWGSEGIAVNVVAADASALAPAAEGLPSVSLSPPALGAAAVDDLDAIARLIALLVTGGADALTGATLSADGGSWMAP